MTETRLQARARELARATLIDDATGTLVVVCRQAILDGEGTVDAIRRIWREATREATRET